MALGIRILGRVYMRANKIRENRWKKCRREETNLEREQRLSFEVDGVYGQEIEKDSTEKDDEFGKNDKEYCVKKMYGKGKRIFKGKWRSYKNRKKHGEGKE